MKKPIRKSLLEQILYGNIRVIGFFVLLVWIYGLISMSYNTYHSQLNELQGDLYLYVDTVEKSLQQAVIHSEHIVQSSFINSTLKRTEYSTTEMMEMLDYSKEILVASSGSQNSPKIFTPNDALFESRWYSHISKLPNHQILNGRSDCRNLILFLMKKSKKCMEM